MNEPDAESIRLAMDHAWRDHHHARDQTWKAVQMEAVLAAGLVTVDAQFGSLIATVAAAALVIIVALFGVAISLGHRKVEMQKFHHILNCGAALGLHRDDLISTVGEFAVGRPRPMHWYQAFFPIRHSTALFILRMHFAIMAFALVMVCARWLS